MTWGQAIEFKPPRPITWIPNKVCHMQCATDLRVPIIPADIRANLASLSPVQVEVSIFIADGREQFMEDNITLHSNAKKHDIVNAWTALMLQGA
jgi:hypothetical protein